MHTFIKHLVLASVAFVVCTGTVIGQNNRFTVRVDCGPQGIVDDNHELTVTVKRGGDEYTVTVPVSTRTDSGAIAEGICTKLNDVVPPCEGFPIRSEETKNPEYPTEGTGTSEENKKENKRKTEDVVLPECMEIVSAKVKRQVGKKFEENDGQLKIQQGKKVLTHQDMPAALVLSYDVKGSSFPLNLSLGLYTLGIDDVTVLQRFRYQATVASSDLHPLADLAAWLQANLGAAVSFTSETAIEAIVPASLGINWVYAHASEGNSQNVTADPIAQLKVTASYN